MSLINRAAVKRFALDVASANFKERNKTRLEMGLAPLKCVPSRVSKDFLDTVGAKVVSAVVAMVNDHKTGLTL
ncbi:MAG: hypothetical protein EBT48_05995 [Verrucomicrobia bacterium]|nr:hypothetical protein [Verrucomicrobiota bacterium]